MSNLTLPENSMFEPEIANFKPTMIINLKKSECLPIMQEAFRSKQLQIFTDPDMGKGSKCSYCAPCVIGVCMTKEQQEYCDMFDNTMVDVLIEKKVISTDDYEFFSTVQELHDDADVDGLARYLGIEDCSSCDLFDAFHQVSS